MSTIIPTYDEFIERFPAFANLNEDQIEMSLGFSSGLLSSMAWGSSYSNAIGLDTAHMLTIEAMAGNSPTGGIQAAVGPVTSVSGAGVSTSFQAFDVTPGSKSDAWYSKTIYGQMFLRLRNSVMPMGDMCA